MTQSALILEVPNAEPLVQEWRHRFDPVSLRGIPAHITVLVPFQPPADIDRSTLDLLARLTSGIEPPSFSLVAVEEFPDAVWLRPEPADGLIRLTASVWSAFPDCPPYGGKFREPNPHLTMAQSTDPERLAEMRRELEAAVVHRLPLDCRIAALSLFVSDRSTRWTLRQRFPFSGG